MHDGLHRRSLRNEAMPAFYVGELHESEVTVRAQFDATMFTMRALTRGAAAVSNTASTPSSKM